jgi:hypothetical protein
LLAVASCRQTARPGLALAVLVASMTVAACGGGSTSAVPPPSTAAGGLTQGLIAYSTDQGIGVLDPASGKTTLVVPFPAGGAFRVAGPVWGPAPDLSYPVLYFAIHDDRPAESRQGGGVVPYNWLFRADPFTGALDPLAASQDSQSEGPIGLVANDHYLALTSGCCTSYEVDTLDLTRPAGPLRVLSQPPTQAAFFTEGIAPAGSGLIAVREFGTGAWYWLNADAGVLNPFPLALGQDDGPVAISADGSLAAVALPDQGAVIEPISVAVPVAPTPSPSGGPTGATPAASSPSPKPSPSVKPTPSAAAAPRRVNSKLPHPDGLAWSPDAKLLALAVNGELEIYQASSQDGTAPQHTYLAGGNVVAVSWSAPILGRTLAMIKPDHGPQSAVDSLLAATQLPAAADTPANRPFTKVYLWQFDSTKVTPIDSITDATAAVLAQYPPLPAGVVFHHWAPSGDWPLLGGCLRYRFVITGSGPPTAGTFGLPSNSACGAKASPSASPKASSSAPPNS